MVKLFDLLTFYGSFLCGLLNNFLWMDFFRRNLCEKIKASSAQPPFCVPYHHKIFDSISVSISIRIPRDLFLRIFPQVPIQAAYLYDAVLIYARALTEVLNNNEDPRNGSAILSRIINRSYHSIQGYDVSRKFPFYIFLRWNFTFVFDHQCRLLLDLGDLVYGGFRKKDRVKIALSILNES